MVLSKIKIQKPKRNKKQKKSLFKIKVKNAVGYLNRPINTKRIEEIEEEKLRARFQHPFIM